MKKNKLIEIRKTKFTQQEIAEKLHMTQSQYQRREKGEIKITQNEWERIAKILDTPVENIREEETCFDYNIGQVSEKSPASELYFEDLHVFLLETQKKYIGMLEQENRRLKDELLLLKSKSL